MEQMRFWFVDARSDDSASVCVAVAAWTERSARVQARKLLGPDWVIDPPKPVQFAHAWLIDFRNV